VPAHVPIDGSTRTAVSGMIRAEVGRLLSVAGLTDQDLASSVEMDVLVDECICTLEDIGASVEDEEAVKRVVLRSLLVGVGQSRSVTHLAQAETDGGQEDEIPQLFCACPPPANVTRARHHHRRAAMLTGGTPEHGIAQEHEDAMTCTPGGCPDPCTTGSGPCVVS